MATLGAAVAGCKGAGQLPVTSRWSVRSAKKGVLDHSPLSFGCVDERRAADQSREFSFHAYPELLSVHRRSVRTSHGTAEADSLQQED